MDIFSIELQGRGWKSRLENNHLIIEDFNGAELELRDGDLYGYLAKDLASSRPILVFFLDGNDLKGQE